MKKPSRILVTTNSNVKASGPSFILGKSVIQSKQEFITVCREIWDAVQENPNLRYKIQLDNITRGEI